METYASFEGTILEVRRGFVRAVFSRSASDQMEDRVAAGGTWRIDRYSPETTYQRQLKVGGGSKGGECHPNPATCSYMGCKLALSLVPAPEDRQVCKHCISWWPTRLTV